MWERADTCYRSLKNAKCKLKNERDTLTAEFAERKKYRSLISLSALRLKRWDNFTICIPDLVRNKL